MYVKTTNGLPIFS